MKTWQSIVLGVILSTLIIGVLLITVSPPRGEPVELNPRPSQAPMVVHVAGEVHKPGVYSLPKESRVADAVKLAGGCTKQADQNTVNLAEKLKDGDHILIPSIEENFSANNLDKSTSAIVENQIDGSILININEASKEMLETLPGIGPTRAEDIIKYREANGLFYAAEDITKVSGIGPGTFEDLKDKITTGF